MKKKKIKAHLFFSDFYSTNASLGLGSYHECFNLELFANLLYCINAKLTVKGAGQSKSFLYTFLQRHSKMARKLLLMRLVYNLVFENQILIGSKQIVQPNLKIAIDQIFCFVFCLVEYHKNSLLYSFYRGIKITVTKQYCKTALLLLFHLLILFFIYYGNVKCSCTMKKQRKKL